MPLVRSSLLKHGDLFLVVQFLTFGDDIMFLLWFVCFCFVYWRDYSKRYGQVFIKFLEMFFQKRV